MAGRVCFYFKTRKKLVTPTAGVTLKKIYSALETLHSHKTAPNKNLVRYHRVLEELRKSRVSTH